MNRIRLVGAVLAAIAAALTATTAAATPAPTIRSVCPPARPGFARCFVEVSAAGAFGAHVTNPLPGSYGPADLQAAYHLPATGGADQTVGIVDAGDDPNAEADLATYRSAYGLPPCTTANGCFRKINQRGQAGPLPPNAGWAIEISLDVDMVSAACPQCKILLVEGDSPSVGDLGSAVDTAVAAGATEVSNSYGADEGNGLDQFAAHYKHSGVAILASSGDAGFGVPSFPAAFDSVISVGGTSLRKADNARGWTETAWARAGSGCSAWIAKPAWQHDPNCPGRMVSDVSSVADPATGVAIYDSFDGPGWVNGGGTSASSPFVSAVIALAGNPGEFGDASPLYATSTGLNDVVSGSNAFSYGCGGDYLCTGGPGYDGPTGNGTPNGISAF